MLLKQIHLTILVGILCGSFVVYSKTTEASSPPKSKNSINHRKLQNKKAALNKDSTPKQNISGKLHAKKNALLKKTLPVKKIENKPSKMSKPIAGPKPILCPKPVPCPKPSPCPKPTACPKSVPITPTVSEKNYDKERLLFIQAESAMTNNHSATYESLKKQLSQYPLYPYLLFAEYDKKIATLSYADFADFLEQYGDSPLSEQLRSRWLQTRAQQAHWEDFLKAYQPTENVSLQCHYLWGEMQTNPNPKSFLKQIQPLWMNGKEPPKNCQDIFALWEKSGFMTRPMIWQKIKLLIQENNKQLTRKLAQHLKKDEIPIVELWLTVHDNPHLVKQSKYFTGNHPAFLEILVEGVSSIAKKDSAEAIKIWQQIGQKYPFTERHWGLVVRAIGISFAKDRNPEAEKWLSKVPGIYANKEVHEWRVRVALIKEDWPSVIRWIKEMPDPIAKSEEWAYWHGRALEMVKRSDESHKIFEKLATTRSYYGFLASHQLKKPFTLANFKLSRDKLLMKSIAYKASVLRAKELYTLGRQAKAKTEWLFSTKRMSDKERHAAASLALHWSMPNWSILALASADDKNDLELRFPVVYGNHILREANYNQIDPAWILAVTRQESAFLPHARSPSGALGLMQLMPGTAHEVAKKKGFHLGGLQALYEPQTNIQIGSSYLKSMLDTNNNHLILATASYNAGAGRVKKWLPAFDMSPDIWIETIPYKETREYVKNVMTYTIIYQEMLGKKSTLQRHLTHIPANEKG